MQKILCFTILSFSTLLLSVAYAQRVQVSGVAHMHHALVNSNSSVKGPLDADHSNFNGNLTITGDKAVLSASNVKGQVTIISKKKATLELRCGSNIAGTIVFQGSVGVVKKTASSNISGNVTNGTIELISSENCK